MTEGPQIAAISTAWLLLLFGLRFAAVGFLSLAPVGHAGWQVLWGKGLSGDSLYRRFGRAIDSLYIRLLSSLTTPASATLVYSGIVLIGSGVTGAVTGNVARFASRNPSAWVTLDNALDTIAAPMTCAGMACIIAAVSTKRTASLIMSLGWGLAGIGIGIVTAAWGSP